VGAICGLPGVSPPTNGRWTAPRGGAHGCTSRSARAASWTAISGCRCSRLQHDLTQSSSSL